MTGWMLAAALLVSTPNSGLVPPPTEQIMAIPLPLHALLQERVIDRTHGKDQRLRLLLELISLDSNGLAMQYQDSATQTVEESFLSRRANCLTYTLLFLALAREAGLDAIPQGIDETLAWQQRQDIVFRSNHVNALVRIGSRRFVVDVGSRFVIARHPATPISQQRLLAQYYNNRAAQLMEQGELSAALAFADRAIALDPTYPITWSNTGVVLLRNGDKAAAERAYLKSLALDPRQSSALFNLVNFYERTGNEKKAAEYRQQLEKLQQVDPFHQFLMGVEYESKGNSAEAVRRYQQAIHLLRTEPRFYLALARAHVQAGNLRRAHNALQRAVALSKDEIARAEYRAALDRLKATGIFQIAPGSVQGAVR